MREKNIFVKAAPKSPVGREAEGSIFLLWGKGAFLRKIKNLQAQSLAGFWKAI